MTLENSLAAGWIQKQDPDPRMIAELLKISDRELSDSKGNISDEGRFAHAYNAALQAAVAALAAAGYRVPKGQSANVRAFEVLAETAEYAASLRQCQLRATPSACPTSTDQPTTLITTGT